MNKLRIITIASILTCISPITANIKVNNKIWLPIKFEYHWADPIGHFFGAATKHSFVILPQETKQEGAGGIFIKTRFIVQIPDYPAEAVNKYTKLLSDANIIREYSDSPEAKNLTNQYVTIFNSDAFAQADPNGKANILEEQAKNIVLDPQYQTNWITKVDDSVDAGKGLGAGFRYIEVSTKQTNIAKAMRGEMDIDISNSPYLW